MENILVNKFDTVKLIDFGFSIKASETKRLSLFCGTPSYMAPEISGKPDYLGRPIDMWAVGVLGFRLLFGSFPFRGRSERDLFFKINHH